MKKRYLFGLLFAATLTLTSCTFFSFVTGRLASLKISDENISYLLGQKYSSDNALTITATYEDETTKTLTLDEVTPTLTCEGQTYNYRNAFTVPGEYTLKVSKDGIESNEINFTVFEEVQYISSFTIDGENSMYVDGITILTVDVTPTYFTVALEATSSNNEIARVSKTGKTEFTVSALAEGEVDITISGKNSESTYYEKVHHLSITKKTTTDMAYTYADVKNNNYYNTPGFPLSGSPKILIVPVWFTDSNNYIKNSSKSNVISDIRKAYFGTKSETGWNSVSSYYEEESSGELTIDGTVSSWWECGLTSAMVSQYKNSNTLAIGAADWYFQNNPSDSRKNYDANNDGYIDSIMMIYASPDSQVITSYGENMWAYCFWVQDSNQRSDLNPGVNTYFWASYDFMYGNNTAYSRTGNTYYNGDTSHCTIDAHTFIHEMGHVLGLDDYYDYAPLESRFNPAGGFSMQDNNVGSHDPFSLTALGWTSVIIPTGNCELTLSDFQTSRQVILLSASWNNLDSPFDEYMLLELYSATGLNKFDSDYQYRNVYPQGPNDVGVRLWHVDARLVKSYSFTVDAGQQGVRGAFNNTSLLDDDGGRTCEAGAAYQNFNLLQLIRNNSSSTTQEKADLRSSDLFKEGSSFAQSNFSQQFPNGNKLNKNVTLGWQFSVTKILNDEGVNKATISFVRN